MAGTTGQVLCIDFFDSLVPQEFCTDSAVGSCFEMVFGRTDSVVGSFEVEQVPRIGFGCYMCSKLMLRQQRSGVRKC